MDSKTFPLVHFYKHFQIVGHKYTNMVNFFIISLRNFVSSYFIVEFSVTYLVYKNKG